MWRNQQKVEGLLIFCAPRIFTGDLENRATAVKLTAERAMQCYIDGRTFHPPGVQHSASMATEESGHAVK